MTQNSRKNFAAQKVVIGGYLKTEAVIGEKSLLPQLLVRGVINFRCAPEKCELSLAYHSGTKVVRIIRIDDIDNIIGLILRTAGLLSIKDTWNIVSVLKFVACSIVLRHQKYKKADHNVGCF